MLAHPVLMVGAIWWGRGEVKQVGSGGFTADVSTDISRAHVSVIVVNYSEKGVGHQSG